MTTTTRIITAAAALLVTSTSLHAQQGTSRWQPFYGCWSPSSSQGQAALDPKLGPIVCVQQTAEQGVVEFSTILNGKVESRDTVDGRGSERAIASKECNGTQSAHFSADDRRVYMTSTMRCGNQTSTASSLLGITPNGEWIDIRGTRAGEGTNVRVARYRPVDMKTFRTDLPASLGDMLSAAQGARIAAGAPVGTSAVIEVVKSVDVAVAEAWLMERAQPFDINASTLVTLADAGVPGRITDALVAVSNPGEFQFARAGTIVTDDNGSGRRTVVMMDPWGWGRSSYGYGYGYGYSPYDYYGNAYGYSRYGYGYGSYYQPPIVIVNNNTGNGANTLTTNPRVVKGRGYTQNTGAESTSTGQSSSSTQQSSGSSSSGSSSAKTTTTPQPSTERTAKPRP